MADKKTDSKELREILVQFDDSTVRTAIEGWRVCPILVSSSDCAGRRIAVDGLKPRKPGEAPYASNYFFLDDASSKAKVIADFLGRFTRTAPCTGGCDPSSGQVCRPSALRFTATEGSAEMTLMQGKLGGRAVGQYLLQVNEVSKGDFITECRCISQGI